MGIREINERFQKFSLPLDQYIKGNVDEVSRRKAIKQAGFFAEDLDKVAKGLFYEAKSDMQPFLLFPLFNRTAELLDHSALSSDREWQQALSKISKVFLNIFVLQSAFDEIYWDEAKVSKYGTIYENALSRTESASCSHNDCKMMYDLQMCIAAIKVLNVSSQNFELYAQKNKETLSGQTIGNLDKFKNVRTVQLLATTYEGQSFACYRDILALSLVLEEHSFDVVENNPCSFEESLWENDAFATWLSPVLAKGISYRFANQDLGLKLLTQEHMSLVSFAVSDRLSWQTRFQALMSLSKVHRLESLNSEEHMLKILKLLVDREEKPLIHLAIKNLICKGVGSGMAQKWMEAIEKHREELIGLSSIEYINGLVNNLDKAISDQMNQRCKAPQ